MLYTTFGIVIPWLLVGVGVLLVYELIRLNGRVLLRLDSLDQQLMAARRPPCPVFRSRPAAPARVGDRDCSPRVRPARPGRQPAHPRRVSRPAALLLIFFNPHCGFFARMADAVAELSPEGRRRASRCRSLVSTGSEDDNRTMVAEYGLRCRLLLQPHMEVATRFGVTVTPSGYLIDEQSAIASPMSVGAVALLALVRPAAAKQEEPATGELPSAPAVRPDPGAPVDAGSASASNGRPACAKCKGAKTPCKRCSDLAEAANHKTNGVVPAPTRVRTRGTVGRLHT